MGLVFDMVVLALAVEDVASKAFRQGHAQVNKEADAREAHARFFLVGRGQVVIVVRVVVVAVAGVASLLRLGRRCHDGWVQMASAVGSRSPVEERGFRRTREETGGGAQDATLEPQQRRKRSCTWIRR